MWFVVAFGLIVFVAAGQVEAPSPPPAPAVPAVVVATQAAQPVTTPRTVVVPAVTPVSKPPTPPQTASATRVTLRWRAVRTAIVYSCPSTTCSVYGNIAVGDTTFGTQYGDWVATWTGWVERSNLAPV